MALEYHTIPSILAVEGYQGTEVSGVSPNGRYLITNIYRGVWTLDRTDEGYESAIDPDTFANYNGMTIDNDGTVYATEVTSGNLIKLPDFGRGTPEILYTGGGEAAVNASLGLFVMPDASKKLIWADGFEDNGANVYDIATDIRSSVGGHAGGNPFTQIVQDSYGDVWGICLLDSGDLFFKRVADGGSGTAAPDTNTVSGFAATSIYNYQVYHSSGGWFVCWSGGADLYLLDDTDFSEIEHREWGRTGTGTFTSGSPLNGGELAARPQFLLGVEPGLETFWFPGPESYSYGEYRDLHEINAADLTTLDTHHVDDWEIGDVPQATGGMIFTTNTRLALFSNNDFGTETIGDYTPTLRYFTDADAEDPGDVDDSVRLRVWGYSLDGHDIYVLRLGPGETLIYDLTTGMWAEWRSPDRDNWRAHVGQNWIGMSVDTMTLGFGTDIVCGDDSSGTLFILDPTAGRDDRTTEGSDPFDRIVTTGMAISGRNTIPCGALQLSYSGGDPSQAGASFLLETSDDFGRTWLSHGSVTVTAGDWQMPVEWRSLGLAKQPGRVFRITDNGAAVRFSGADLR